MIVMLQKKNLKSDAAEVAVSLGFLVEGRTCICEPCHDSFTKRAKDLLSGKQGHRLRL